MVSPEPLIKYLLNLYGTKRGKTPCQTKQNISNRRNSEVTNTSKYNRIMDLHLFEKSVENVYNKYVYVYLI